MNTQNIKKEQPDDAIPHTQPHEAHATQSVKNYKNANNYIYRKTQNSPQEHQSQPNTQEMTQQKPENTIVPSTASTQQQAAVTPSSPAQGMVQNTQQAQTTAQTGQAPTPPPSASHEEFSAFLGNPYDWSASYEKPVVYSVSDPQYVLNPAMLRTTENQEKTQAHENKGNDAAPETLHLKPASSSGHSDPSTDPLSLHDTAFPEHDKPRMGTAGNLFTLCAHLAPFFLLLLTATLHWSWIYLQPLYTPLEGEIVSTFFKMQDQSIWLTPPSLDTAAPEGELFYRYPLCYWFFGLIYNFITPDQAWTFPLATFFISFFLLLGIYVFGISVGLGTATSLAASLMLFASPGFLTLSSLLLPNLLATAILAFALACFVRSWRKNHAWLSLLFAFSLTALGFLCGGLPYLLIPLISSFCLLIWTGRYGRGNAFDAINGFFIMLVILLAWIGAIIFTNQSPGYLRELESQLIPQNIFLKPELSKEPYLWLIFMLFPWFFLPLFASWGRILRNLWSDLKSSRKEQQGHAWLWIVCVITLCLYPFFWKTPAQAIILAPAAFLLLAKALSQLSYKASKLFYLFPAVFAILAGVTLSLITNQEFMEYTALTLPKELIHLLERTGSYIYVPSIILVCAGISLLFFTQRFHPHAALLVMTFWIVVIAQPVALWIIPSLEGKEVYSLEDVRNLNKAAALPELQQTPTDEATPETAPEPQNAPQVLDDNAAVSPTEMPPVTETLQNILVPPTQDQAPDSPSSPEGGGIEERFLPPALLDSSKTPPAQQQ